MPGAKAPQEYGEMLHQQIRDPAFIRRMQTIKLLGKLYPGEYGERYEKAKGGMRQMAHARNLLRRGIKREDVASELGIGKATLDLWIRGKAKPRSTILRVVKEAEFPRTHPEFGALVGSAFAHTGIIGNRSEVFSQDREFAEQTRDAYDAVTGEEHELQESEGYPGQGGEGTYYGFIGYNDPLRHKILKTISRPEGKRHLKPGSLTWEQEDRMLELLFDGNGFVIDREDKKGDPDRGVILTKRKRIYGKLLRQVQQMLAKRGVLSHIKKGSKGDEILSIRGPGSLKAFDENIGFRVADKDQSLKRCIEKPPATREYTVDQYYNSMEYAELHPQATFADIGGEFDVHRIVVRDWVKRGAKPYTVKWYEEITGGVEEAQNEWRRKHRSGQRIERSVIPIPGLVSQATLNEITSKIRKHESDKRAIRAAMETADPSEFNRLNRGLERISEDIEEYRKLYRRVKEQVENADKYAEPETETEKSRRRASRRSRSESSEMGKGIRGRSI